MKLQIALVLFGFCSLANGEIYSYIDPATGAKEYTNQAKKGATRMTTSDTLPRGESACGAKPKQLETDEDVAAEKARVAQCALDSEQQSKHRAKQYLQAVTALSKEHPGACSKTRTGASVCVPRVGINIQRHAMALEMSYDGFTEDAANGKLDRWRGVCRAFSKKGVIVSVSC